MPKTSFFKKFISSSYGPVIIGILFTGLIGWGFNYFIQSQIRTRQESFEIYKKKVASAKEIMKEVVNLINSRMYSLRLVITTYKNVEIDDAEYNWYQYLEQVRDWNFNDDMYKKRLDISFGSELANEFIGNTDSVQSYFWKAHKNVLAWRACLRRACIYSTTGKGLCKTNKCNEEKALSEKSLSILKKKTNQYIDDLYAQFRIKYLKHKIP